MSLIHLTEGARSRTGRAHEQKRRCFLGVAFSPVGTAPFFANGMNLALFDNALDGGEFAGFGNGTAQPRRHGLHVIASLAGWSDWCGMKLGGHSAVLMAIFREIEILLWVSIGSIGSFACSRQKNTGDAQPILIK